MARTRLSGDSSETPVPSLPDDAPPADPRQPPAPAGGDAPHREPAERLTYRSRIHINDAWKYPGTLANAPEWVDRSWTSWVPYDDQTKTEAGPALKVPTLSLASPQAEKLCRVGDYIVRQRVSLAEDVEETVVEVWPQAEFERLFLPIRDRIERDS
jgi:hypothetical protein